MALGLLLLFFLVALASIQTSLAEIRETKLRSDSRSIVPLNQFGYTHHGALVLKASGISISESNPDIDISRLGFLLTTRDAWAHVREQIEERDVDCPLDSNLIRPVYTFDRLREGTNGNASKPLATSFDVSVPRTDPGLYTAVFINCLPGDVKVSMDVVSIMYNMNTRAGIPNYLSVGSTILPLIYSLFFIIYAILSGIWVYVLYLKRRTAFRIHFFMLAVVVLKAFNLLFEAEDKSHINKTGSAHGWDVLFYIFSFLRGIMLFTLIVLIGTGWSFLKPYLQDKEKKVLMIVIPLQVVANIAQVAIDETGPYAHDWVTWRQIFLLVDVLCCCAVLFPIVWSIKNLREAARTDGKAAVNLMKLTLFRQYYIVVICYIYFTRVIVYALQTICSYRYTWTSVMARELATLAFYVFTAYKFRPEVHNPYFALDDEEEEAAAEALKLSDEFEL